MDLFVVGGCSLSKWVSLRLLEGYASGTSATLCKTTSDVDIMRNHRYRYWGGPIATPCLAHFADSDTRELSYTKVVCQSLSCASHESGMLGGQGADFLRGVASCSIRSSGLL